jgi:Fic family protein
MEQLLVAIALKKELDRLRPIKPEDEARIMQKFRLDWNYHSNNLEGNSLSYGETKALILFGLTAQGKPLKDHFEITGHDEAIKEIIEVVHQKRPLTENFIRELHKLILKEPYEVDAITPAGQPTKKKIQVGVYKSTPNHVRTRTGEIFRFASPEETPAKMHDLIEWYRSRVEQQEMEPILLASEFHYKFIRIHPFDDGNGRTVRLLMNFILMQFGYPPVIIRTEDKENYFAALQQADAGMLEPFVDYITKNLVRSLEIMIKGAKGEDIEEADDLDKEVALLQKKLKASRKDLPKFRTNKILAELFTRSGIVLISRFVSKCKKFDKLYKKSGLTLVFEDDTGINGETHTAKQFYTEHDFERVAAVTIRYDFEALRELNIGELKYTSLIHFQFDHTGYSVKDRIGKITIEKKYGLQLSPEEIDEVIKAEINTHKMAIEELVKKVRDLNQK